jgi:hypothetical protein
MLPPGQLQETLVYSLVREQLESLPADLRRVIAG